MTVTARFMEGLRGSWLQWLAGMPLTVLSTVAGPDPVFFL